MKKFLLISMAMLFQYMLPAQIHDDNWRILSSDEIQTLFSKEKMPFLI